MAIIIVCGATNNQLAIFFSQNKSTQATNHAGMTIFIVRDTVTVTS
jgi:hypothetical protein